MADYGISIAEGSVLVDLFDNELLKFFQSIRERYYYTDLYIPLTQPVSTGNLVVFNDLGLGTVDVLAGYSNASYRKLYYKLHNSTTLRVSSTAISSNYVTVVDLTFNTNDGKGNWMWFDVEVLVYG
jgi:hypothetical protein